MYIHSAGLCDQKILAEKNKMCMGIICYNLRGIQKLLHKMYPGFI